MTPHAAAPAAIIALLFAPPAIAAPGAAGGEQVELSWVRGEGADDCAGRAAIAREVAARLGRDPFAPEARRSIEVEVTRDRDRDRWVARIHIRERGVLQGTRELESDDARCASLEAASVLAIALAIDPEAALGPPPPHEAPPPLLPAAPPPRAASPVPAPAQIDHPAPDHALPPGAAPPRFALMMRGAGASGLVPGVAPALAWAADIDDGIGRVTAGALWIPEADTETGDFSFGLTAGWLGACIVPFRPARLSIASCAAAFGGAVHAVVRRLEPTDPGDRAWTALSFAERLRVDLLPPLAAELGVELLAPLTRHRFRVEGRPEPVFTQPAAAILWFAGLGVSIP